MNENGQAIVDQDIKITFCLHQDVYIKDLQRKGRIKAIYISATGTQYEVRYFDNCKAELVYFFPDELSCDI